MDSPRMQAFYFENVLHPQICVDMTTLDFYLHPWSLLTQAIIPSAPDAWLWLGDFAYLDNTAVSVLHCSEKKSW